MGPCIVNNILVYNCNKMHKSQSWFYLTTAVHVSGVTITHLQEHKTTITTVSGNRYTVIDRVKFTDKEYRQTRLKLRLNNVYFAENTILWNNEWCTYPYCCLLFSWKSWNWFECVVGGVLICLCFHVVADVSMVSMANWNNRFCSPKNIHYSIVILIQSIGTLYQ